MLWNGLRLITSVFKEPKDIGPPGIKKASIIRSSTGVIVISIMVRSLQLFERSRTTSGRQESKKASIIKVPMSNYFAQRPLSDPRNPFRPDPPVGSSKSPVSVSPKDPRRILEVPFSTYCAQRPPVGSSKSPSLLRPETLPSDPRSPFRPDPPPSDPRSPLL